MRWLAPRLIGFRPMSVLTMELFTTLFGNLLAFVYHCFDRIVIHGCHQRREFVEKAPV